MVDLLLLGCIAGKNVVSLYSHCRTAPPVVEKSGQGQRLRTDNNERRQRWAYHWGILKWFYGGFIVTNYQWLSVVRKKRFHLNVNLRTPQTQLYFDKLPFYNVMYFSFYTTPGVIFHSCISLFLVKSHSQKSNTNLTGKIPLSELRYYSQGQIPLTAPNATPMLKYHPQGHFQNWSALCSFTSSNSEVNDFFCHKVKIIKKITWTHH